MKLRDIKKLYTLLKNGNILLLQRRILLCYADLDLDTLDNLKDLIECVNYFKQYNIAINKIEDRFYRNIEDDVEDMFWGLKPQDNSMLEVEVPINDGREYEENYILIKMRNIRNKIVKYEFFKVMFDDYDLKGINKENIEDYRISEEEYDDLL